MKIVSNYCIRTVYHCPLYAQQYILIKNPYLLIVAYFVHTTIISGLNKVRRHSLSYASPAATKVSSKQAKQECRFVKKADRFKSR